ncbi:MAG: hypothetical protein ACKOAS_04710 [Verrucomicrobiota bacterium]
MQYFTLIGGFVGFLLTFAVSLFAGKDLAESVFNATIGCIIVGLLFRGFRAAAEHCAKQIVAEKTRLRDEQRAAEEAANAEAPPEAAQPPAESQAAA